MSDIPNLFTANYYDQEYFKGQQGGKKFLSGNQTKQWSYYNKTGESPACKPIAEAWKTIFKPKTMLDAGAGRGTQIAYARNTGIKAVGFDWSSWAVNEGRYKQCKSNWLIRHDGTQPLPYKTGSFNLTVALDYMEHMYVEDVKNVLKEFYRVTNKYLFLETDVVDGKREKGYILQKNMPVPPHLEGNAVAGHVTVQTEQWWCDWLDEFDWIRRRDMEHWFISLVPPEAIRNWLLNSILVYEK